MTDMERFCARLGITASVKFGNAESNRGGLDDWKSTATPYTVTLRRSLDGKRREMSVSFWQGSGILREPSAAAVLSCVVSDATSGAMTFEEFCAEMGESTDSRKAESTWKACRKSGKRVRAFLGADFPAAQNASH